MLLLWAVPGDPGLAALGPNASGLVAAWRELETDERARLVRIHMELSRNPESPRILANADGFAGFPPERRQALRDLAHRMREAVSQAPAGTARWIETLPPGARALAIYRLLSTQQREELRAGILSRGQG